MNEREIDWTVRLRVPPQPLLRSILVRTLLVWLFVRAFAAYVIADGIASDPGAPLGHPIVSVIVAGVVVAAMRVELIRQGELVLLENLGRSFAATAALIALECSVLEIAMRLALG